MSIRSRFLRGVGFGAEILARLGLIQFVSEDKQGGDDVPRRVKTEKYKPRLKKDDFGNEIQPEIKQVTVAKVSNYTLQDTQLLLNRLELQAEQDDEEALLMLL